MSLRILGHGSSLLKMDFNKEYSTIVLNMQEGKNQRRRKWQVDIEERLIARLNTEVKRLTLRAKHPVKEITYRGVIFENSLQKPIDNSLELL